MTNDTTHENNETADEFARYVCLCDLRRAVADAADETARIDATVALRVYERWLDPAEGDAVEAAERELASRQAIARAADGEIAAAEAVLSSAEARLNADVTNDHVTQVAEARVALNVVKERGAILRTVVSDANEKVTAARLALAKAKYKRLRSANFVKACSEEVEQLIALEMEGVKIRGRILAKATDLQSLHLEEWECATKLGLTIAEPSPTRPYNAQASVFNLAMRRTLEGALERCSNDPHQAADQLNLEIEDFTLKMHNSGLYEEWRAKRRAVAAAPVDADAAAMVEEPSDADQKPRSVPRDQLNEHIAATHRERVENWKQRFPNGGTASDVARH